MSIDLYSTFSSLTRANAKRSDRLTTLDAPVTRKAAKPTRARRADRENPARFLQHLVEGRPLSAIFATAPGLAKLVGLDDLTQNQFQEFLRGFAAGLTTLGFTGGEPRQRQAKRHYGAVGGDRLPLPGAGGMVRRRTRMDQPRAVRRFDEFAAMFAGLMVLWQYVAVISSGVRDSSREP